VIGVLLVFLVFLVSAFFFSVSLPFFGVFLVFWVLLWFLVLLFCSFAFVHCFFVHCFFVHLLFVVVVYDFFKTEGIIANEELVSSMED